MTIDANELRRLAQEATPGPWKKIPVGDGRQKFAVADSEFLSILTVTDEGGATFGTVYDDADAKFMTAANPATISELLDRLEAAEKERDAAELMSLALRARVEQMERQEPVFWWRPCSDGTYEGPLHNNSIERVRKLSGAWSPLYALPGAQPDSSVPEGWMRVIDEALVIAHIGVANAHDTYEQAKAKLDNLIGFNVDIATDPAVNGGWKLMPTEPTQEIRDAWTSHMHESFRVAYQAMLAAAPEAKP